MQDFFVDKRIQISHFVIYYFFQFVKRADLLSSPCPAHLHTQSPVFNELARRADSAAIFRTSHKKDPAPLFLFRPTLYIFQSRQH